ncbi:DUF6702 family protein [Caulobacter sp. RHG1]|uniref:DUF6702 family protein n=1 Tax=Caulobacter sp. (strain RHG1) TaxID=2545762 RepID=UPI001555EC47|nr:DUF6702 family protein [Caulobacter sp. RHG1]NQE64638.1 hypothetical protein [Caulobacter sp. RHG1]
MRAAVLIAAAGLVLAPLPAAAHRGHGALSVVEIDAKTGGMKVTHRIPAHDAEPALALIAPNAQASLDDPDAIAALKTYMLRSFRVAVNGQAVDLALKDMTLGADEVRFEYAGQVAPADVRAEITVRAAMFADVYDDEVNQVNIRRLGTTRTLVFASGEAWQPQSLDAVGP